LVTDPLPLRANSIQQMNSILCTWCITRRLCPYGARNIVVWLLTDPLPLRGKEHQRKWITRYTWCIAISSLPHRGKG